MKMKQLLILTLAVVFIQACGKKKEAAQQSADPQTAETSAPAPTISSDEAKKRAEAEKLEAERKAKGQGASTKRGGKSVAAKPAAPKAGGGGGSSTTGPSSTESTLSTQDMVVTGGVSKAGLIYTGAAGDMITTQLLAEEKMKTADEYNKNAKFAATIWDMAYLIDGQGKLTIDIELKKGNGLSKIQAETDYKANQQMMIVANSGSASETQVTAECLDKNVSNVRCSNLLVTLVQNGAEATAVLRQTLANIYFEYEEVQQANEYATLVEFFKNSRLDVETPNKVDSAYLHTYEVINGKSGFKVVVVGRKNQLIGFQADLLAKKNFAAANIAVEKVTQFMDIDLYMGRILGKDLAFAHSISNARLVQNNTKGQITIDMTVKSSSTGTSNAFTLKFTRIPVEAQL
jgi:hypothetical protein